MSKQDQRGLDELLLLLPSQSPDPGELIILARFCFTLTSVPLTLQQGVGGLTHQRPRMLLLTDLYRLAWLFSINRISKRSM